MTITPVPAGELRPKHPNDKYRELHEAVEKLTLGDRIKVGGFAGNYSAGLARQAARTFADQRDIKVSISRIGATLWIERI